MSIDEDASRRQYADLLPKLGELRASLVAALQQVELGDVVVESRIKTWESIRSKLSRSPTRTLADIPDLVGIRVVVPDVQQLLEVSETVRRKFGVKSYDATHFQHGESAVHVLVGDDAASAAGLSAEIQVLTGAEEARRALGHALHYSVPIDTHEPASRTLDELLAEFESLIDRPGVHEKRDVHAFLKGHDYFLFPNPDAVTSEVPIGLGTEFRIDFLVQKPDGSYLLIELENPQAELFTKAGEFSATVNHALRQVEDWQEWIEANLPTVERYYPGIRSPEAWIIVGRDRTLGVPERRRLPRRNINMRGRVAIRTYDDVLRDTRAYVGSIRRAFPSAQ